MRQKFTSAPIEGPATLFSRTSFATGARLLRYEETSAELSGFLVFGIRLAATPFAAAKAATNNEGRIGTNDKVPWFRHFHPTL